MFKLPILSLAEGTFGRAGCNSLFWGSCGHFRTRGNCIINFGHLQWGLEINDGNNSGETSSTRSYIQTQQQQENTLWPRSWQVLQLYFFFAKCNTLLRTSYDVDRLSCIQYFYKLVGFELPREHTKMCGQSSRPVKGGRLSSALKQDGRVTHATTPSDLGYDEARARFRHLIERRR